MSFESSLLPFSLGSDKGILDLNQIKSPRMKKRLMANLRGDDDQKNGIASPEARRAMTPDFLSTDQPAVEQNRRAMTPDMNCGSMIPAHLMNNTKPLSPLVRPNNYQPPMPQTPPSVPLYERQASQNSYDQLPIRAAVPQGHASSSPTQFGCGPPQYVSRQASSQPAMSPADFETAVNEQLDGLNSCLNAFSGNNGNQNAYKTRSPQPFEPYSPNTPPIQPRAISNPLFNLATSNSNPGTPLTYSPQPPQFTSSPQPQYLPSTPPQQQYFNVPKPAKISMPESVRQDANPLLPPTSNLAFTPTMQEQWQARRQPPSQQTTPSPPMQQRPQLQQQYSNSSNNNNHAQHTPSPPPLVSRFSVVEEDGQNTPPIQSKSFRVLQKLTEGIEG